MKPGTVTPTKLRGGQSVKDAALEVEFDEDEARWTERLKGGARAVGEVGKPI